MKKQIILTWIAIVISGYAYADGLTDILIDKKYEPRLMSQTEIDSVLTAVSSTATSEQTVWTGANRYELQEQNKRSLFRHSYFADYTLRDKMKGTTLPVGDSLRDVTLSPDKRYIVYGKGQDLYIYKLDYHTTIPITHEYTDGKDIFSGLSDWLYEEEFGRTRLFWFSPDSKMIAFVRLDETEVPTFEWQTFLPAANTPLYPISHTIRYPKAGTDNAQATVYVYDIFTKGLKKMQLGDTEGWYIPSLVWRETTLKDSKAPKTYELVVEKLNRDQNKMEVWAVNPASTVGNLLYTESSNRYYIDYSLFDAWKWLSDGRIIALSEADGWRQLFLLRKDGGRQKVLTPAGMDVTNVYGVDEKNGIVYYQAAPVPSQRQLYAVSLKEGKVTPLSSAAGMHALYLSEDMKHAITSFQSDTQAPTYTLCSLKGTSLTPIRTVLDNQDVQQAWQEAELPQKQFCKIPTERGDSLEAWVIYPTMEPGKRYPVVLFQYSGPASQRVLNRWRHRFAHYLASIGYIIVNADPRGSDCRGRAWRNETYKNLGKKEGEDHLSVARHISSLPQADPDHIAMIGWSYGGYQTIKTMELQEAEHPVIQKGIAIAPVTDWRLYDSGYTERYMQRPQVNESGYQQADLISHAADLTGELLIIHATGDDNVHYQNSLLFMDALIQAGKQFDVQLYIDDNHSIRRPANYEHLHRRIVRFLEQ